MVRYYVGYVDADNNRTGGCDVTMPAPIRNLDDVGRLLANLQAYYRSSQLIVTAFSRYEDEEN